MSKLSTKTVFAVVVLVLSLLVVACAAAAGETVQQVDTFTVSGSPQVEVKIANGSVTVQGTGQPGVVEVSSSIRSPDRVEYVTGQDGDTVIVIATVQGVINLFSPNAGVDTTIVAPPDTALDLETSNGRVSVEGISGTVSARTSNGRITLTDVAGDIEARTSNGEIQIQGSSGQVEGRTSNGRIELTGTLPPGSENFLETSNGDITVMLQETRGVELEAVTSNGTVTSARTVSTTEEPSEERLAGTIGAGGSTLKVETSNGSITIR